MKNPSPIVFGGLLFIFVLLVSSYAQIGEVAGPLNFNVSIGSRESLTFTIINGGSDTLVYMATPTITTSIPNATTPQVIITPMNGTIPPHTQLPLNVTVYMPAGKNKPGMTWNGYISAVAVTNTTIVNGATIQAGALKIMTITAAEPKGQEGYVLVAILVIVGIGVGAYYAVSRLRARKGRAKRPLKRAKKVTKRAARRGKAMRRRKAAARRRTVAGVARRRKRATRRRRRR